VAPTCILYPDDLEFVDEANFHEIFWNHCYIV
jgi:hypothetical protein